jgi:hypothetical protein
MLSCSGQMRALLHPIGTVKRLEPCLGKVVKAAIGSGRSCHSLFGSCDVRRPIFIMPSPHGFQFVCECLDAKILSDQIVMAGAALTQDVLFTDYEVALSVYRSVGPEYGVVIL